MKILLNPLNLKQQTITKPQNNKQHNQTQNAMKAENEKLFMPSTAQYLAFLGGYSLDLNEVYNHLDKDEYPLDIQKMALETIELEENNEKTLYDVHFQKYKGILDCYSLDDLKEKYPEFENVKSAFDVEAKEESVVGKFQNGESEIFKSDEDLSLQLIKLYWGQGFSLTDLSDYIAKNSKDNKGINLYYAMVKKLNIPLMTPRYANVLKKSNKEYNEKFSEQMSIKRKEAKEAKLQLAEGEAVVIPRGPLSETHKQHISEGLKKHYLQNPEKLYAMSERQKAFYEANPEKKEELAEVMLYAWNKTPEGKSIIKHLTKFIKKYNGKTPTIKELTDITELSKQNQEAFGEFWKRNTWAKEKMSIAVKKGWACQSDKTTQIEWVKNLNTIKGQRVVFNIVPTAMTREIEEWAVAKGIKVDDIAVGKSILYEDNNFRHIDSKSHGNCYEKANRVIDKYFDEHPNAPDNIATCILQSIISTEKKLKTNSKDLPKSLKDDFSKLQKLIGAFNEIAKRDEYPILEERTALNTRKEMSTERLRSMQNSLIGCATILDCYDFAEFFDRELDLAYEKLHNTEVFK